jgi:hypothetical protein
MQVEEEIWKVVLSCLPVFVVCIIPSRPLLLLACIVMLEGARA